MGVERRHGRLYEYTARRVGNRVVKTYLGPVTAKGARRKAAAARDHVRAERTAAVEFATGVAAVVAALDPFDRLADLATRAFLHLAGYRLHNRGEWRQTRGTPTMNLNRMLADLLTPQPAAGPQPALVVAAHSDPAVQASLNAAAKGDAKALPAVRELLKNEFWLNALGSTAQFAERSLARLAGGDDLAVNTAVRQKLREQIDKLTADFGSDPPFLLRMAAIRVAHCWTAVHILETMGARRQPGGSEALAIEKQLASAERRLHAAMKSLAVLRRLRMPTVSATIHVESRAGNRCGDRTVVPAGAVID